MSVEVNEIDFTALKQLSQKRDQLKRLKKSISTSRVLKNI